MGKKGLGTVIFVLILVMVMMAGCASRSPQTKSISTTNPVPTMTSPQSYVEEVTPFMTSTAQRQTYPIITAATQPPEDIVCLVYEKNQTFTNTVDAVSFNLINPPIYLNFTVHETNKDSNEKNVYYQITIRDKKTGEIYNQVGLSRDLKLGENTLKLNLDGRTEIIKISSVKELQIETRGNGVKIFTEFWVKPLGNLPSSFDTNGTKCINWPETRWVKLENPSSQ